MLRRMNKVGLAVMGMVCLFGFSASIAKAEQNELVIDLIKLAPYADWHNYYGKIKFGHYQDKANCALYNYLDRDGRKNKTLLMSGQWDQGYSRGKYHLYLPKAEKLLFETNLFAEKEKKRGSVSVGYFLKGKGTTYLIKDKKWAKALECDLSELSGQKCKILLKTLGLSVSGSFENWDKTRIIALYPEKGRADLAVSVSDIEVIPLSGGRVNIKVIIRNIAKTDAGKFLVNLYDRDTLLGEKEVSSLSGKDEIYVNWGPFEIKEGTHEIAVEIVSSGEENSKDNNKAVLLCKFPIYGIMIKNIEGYPYPWRAEKVKVNMTINLIDTTDKLSG